MPEKSEEEKILVVSQLPTQSVNSTELDGKKVRLITFEEALTEILEKVNKIEKSVA